MSRTNVSIGIVNYYQSGLSDVAKYNLASLRLAQSMYQSEGVNTEVISCDLNHIEAFCSYVEEKDFYALTFSTFSWSWDITMKICEIIQDKVNMIFIGGPEVLNHSLEEVPAKAYLIYGEGESFFNELSDCLGKNIKFDNFMQFKSVKETNQNGVYFVCSDWKYKLPLFDEKFLKDIRVDDLGEVLYYETTRGCPFSCAYCGYKYRKKLSGFLSPFIEDEIKRIGKLNVKRIFVVDPILGGTQAGGMTLIRWFKKYAPKVRITAYMRPEFLTEDYIEEIKRGNIACLRFGLQTINKNVSREIRSNDMDAIRKYLSRLSKVGINWSCEIIVGLPGDDILGLMETFMYMIDVLHPTFIHMYHLMIIKDSPLQNAVDSEGKDWIHICEKSRFITECYSFTKEELEYMLQYAELMVLLYNSYATIREHNETSIKITNTAPSFNELNSIVGGIIKDCTNTEHGKYLLKQRVKNDFSVILEDFM